VSPPLMVMKLAFECSFACSETGRTGQTKSAQAVPAAGPTKMAAVPSATMIPRRMTPSLLGDGESLRVVDYIPVTCPLPKPKFRTVPSSD
jgi:hypothetical protein